MDLREEYCYPIPIQVISELFGISDKDTRAELRRLVENIFTTTITAEEAAATYREVHSVLAELVALKRRTPGDDMTSELIAARQEDGSRLGEGELVDTLLMMLSAGHETTVNLLDNAVHALLTHPDQLALVRAGRAGWSDVIEESLRVEAPVANLPLRYAVEDIEAGGVHIAKGEAILASFAAAGAIPHCTGRTRTPSTSPGPTRSTSPSGTASTTASARRWPGWKRRSRCPRSSTRFPDLALAVPAGELRPMASFISNGHRSLPVHLSA